jgi:hypothetical protein
MRYGIIISETSMLDEDRDFSWLIAKAMHSGISSITSRKNLPPPPLRWRRLRFHHDYGSESPPEFSLMLSFNSVVRKFYSGGN